MVTSMETVRKFQSIKTNLTAKFANGACKILA